MSICGCEKERAPVVNTVDIFQSHSFFNLYDRLLKTRTLGMFYLRVLTVVSFLKQKLQSNLAGANPVPDLF
jgi:hypothetical protein